MTIAIQLDSETQQRLASSAERVGQPFDEFVTQILRDHACYKTEDAELTQTIDTLADRGHSFDWLNDERDLYSMDDLKVQYQ